MKYINLGKISGPLCAVKKHWSGDSVCILAFVQYVFDLNPEWYNLNLVPGNKHGKGINHSFSQ